MILMSLVILLIISFILTLANNKSASLCTSGIAIFLFIAIGDGYLAPSLFNHLQKFEPITQLSWAENNGIILLGAGLVVNHASGQTTPSLIAYSRIHEAARLYHDCKNTNHFCSIIITGGKVIKGAPSEAEVYKAGLLNIGIPKEAILEEPKSLNTFQNAEYTAALLQHYSFEKLYLVTSGFHEKRALLYFRHFGIKDAIPAPSDQMKTTHSMVPLAYNFAMTDLALNEYLGIARYYFYNAFGWNKSP